MEASNFKPTISSTLSTSSKLNLSLDDIIKRKNSDAKKTRNRNNFDHSYKNTPLNRKNSKNNNYDNEEMTDSNNFHKKWENFNHKRRNYNYDNDRNKNCRLIISNLSYNVMNLELHSLFSALGKLKRCGIHWDRAGISKGTADIEYENSYDADKAVECLNGTEIEGMKINIEYLNFI